MLKFRKSGLVAPFTKDIPYITKPGPDDLINKWENKEVEKSYIPKHFRRQKNKKRIIKPKKEKTYSGIFNSLLNKITVENFSDINQKIHEILHYLCVSEKVEFIQLLLNKCKDESQYINVYLNIIKDIPEYKEMLINLMESSYKLDTDLKETNHLLFIKREQSIGYFFASITNQKFIYENVVVKWITKLIGENRIECLCKFIQVVDKKSISSSLTSQVMTFLKESINNVKSKQKFMIKDILELEENNWKVIRDSHKELKPDTKENIRNKKTESLKVLHDTAIDNSAKSCLYEVFNLPYEAGVKEVYQQFSDYSKYSNYTLIKKRFIYLCIENCLEKDEITQKNTKILLNFLISKNLITTQEFTQVIQEFYEIIGELRIDIPNIDKILQELTRVN